jgi:hypothetical protein
MLISSLPIKRLNARKEHAMTTDTITTNEKLIDIADVIRFCQEHKLPADVVGRWVWIRFDSKPDSETRDMLKAVGFRWIQKRKQWAHNCGFFMKHNPAINPRDKYGEVPVSAIDLTGIQ